MDKYKNVIEFYKITNKLKNLERSGWTKDKWNVNAPRIESVAEHTFGCCMLLFALNSEFDLKIDFEKTLKMLVIHEIGETVIGDITPYDGISKEDKYNMEHDAIKSILKDLELSDEYYNYLYEFDAHKSKESQIAYYIDKIEADIQCKVYQDNGYQRELDEIHSTLEENERIKELQQNGAKTAFDIWYNVDKDIYINSELFKELLDYIRDNNLKNNQ